jgi:arylsulfatase A-like enzyme
MAEEGLRLTYFYSTSGVCTPSRASLMTGCYPRRVGMHRSGLGPSVLMPMDPKGLHPDEVTLADVLSQSGYATACLGKWHLGDQPRFLPTRHGFDEYLGVPYSEDMVPSDAHPDWPPLPLMRNEEVVAAPVKRDYLTRLYTEDAVRFIRENRDRPFFLYMPHAMPGSCEEPFASLAFRGNSSNGLYGDSVEELDWSAGRILRTLDELDLDERTLVIWTSDNGAVEHHPRQGSNAPLRGWGYDTSEGAQRVPCIARWPGRMPAGEVNDEIVTMMDFLPTLASLAKTEIPVERIIDGQDIGAVLRGETSFESKYDDDGFFYYHMGQLQAVRSGPWKLYLPLQNKKTDLSGDYSGGVSVEAELYDVRNDPGETRERSAENPDVVRRLMALAESAREDLGDWDREGANQRPAGWVDNPTPRVM